MYEHGNRSQTCLNLRKSSCEDGLNCVFYRTYGVNTNSFEIGTRTIRRTKIRRRAVWLWRHGSFRCIINTRYEKQQNWVVDTWTRQNPEKLVTVKIRTHVRTGNGLSHDGYGRNSSQFIDIKSINSWQLSLPYCTRQHFRWLRLTPATWKAGDRAAINDRKDEDASAKCAQRVQEEMRRSRVFWDDRIMWP